MIDILKRQYIFEILLFIESINRRCYIVHCTWLPGLTLTIRGTDIIRPRNSSREKTGADREGPTRKGK